MTEKNTLNLIFNTHLTRKNVNITAIWEVGNEAFVRHVGFKTPLFPHILSGFGLAVSNYLENLLGDVPLATVRPFEGCGCNVMVLHLTMPFRGVRFIFIVSPFHRKIAGREALDLFSSSLPSIEKSPVEYLIRFVIQVVLLKHPKQFYVDDQCGADPKSVMLKPCKKLK
ncbi:hypothetical protein NQ317_012591 [Molorchus minor]|uniref:Uncharacterized protein n=1 Tax=Molorchus minor TaxID=1323400 RepID=A0ABQ9JB48_9CUCU|nr:hypothetical protein NQ317_012591 [Molorchus minor]